MLALSAYNSKTSSLTTIFYSANCNQHDKVQNFTKGVQDHLKFWKIQGDSEPPSKNFLR